MVGAYGAQLLQRRVGLLCLRGQPGGGESGKFKMLGFRGVLALCSVVVGGSGTLGLGFFG